MGSLPPLHLRRVLFQATMAATNGHTGQIPVIDLSGPAATVSKELVDAAATYGFVYIKSLGKDIPVEAIDSIFALVRHGGGSFNSCD